MKNKNFQNAFSLMEMMVVLLIVAIIAAATAPMVTKKMARNVGSGDSPWVFTGLNNNIAYNMSGADASAIIGASSYSHGDNQPSHPRLVLAADGANRPALVFAGADGAYGGQINMDLGHSIVTMNDQTVGNNSVAFGYGQTIGNDKNGVVAVGTGVNCGSEAIAVGHNANAIGQRSIAIGTGASATDTGASATNTSSIAIGTGARTTNGSSIAIGTGARTTDTGASATNTSSIAIGTGARTTNGSSIAIGAGANSTSPNSIAIGAGAITSVPNQIVLGTDQETVYIRGNLIVDGTVMLSMRGSTTRGIAGAVFMRESTGERDIVKFSKADNDLKDHHTPVFQTEEFEGNKSITIMGRTYYYHQSDRRLKNVGEKYTAGLEELKKLDFYHYTFKADKDNTPLVGVMAQDLQKVFPDAVTKGEDGYLRIRLEDMFYAVINAVKELDTKVSKLVADVTGISSKVEEQQKVIEVQQQKIDELEKVNADFEKRLAKLEKKNKKFEE